MSIFSKLFGKKEKQDLNQAAIIERQQKAIDKHVEEIKKLKAENEKLKANNLRLIDENYRLRNQSNKNITEKATINKEKEEQLLKRLSTYEAPKTVTPNKPMLKAQSRNRHSINVKSNSKNPVTDKQMVFIKVIETAVNKYHGYQKIHFNGATKQEAMCWIDQHVKEFRRIENTCIAK